MCRVTFCSDDTQRRLCYDIVQREEPWLVNIPQQHNGLGHEIGHFMLAEVDSKAQAAVPPMPKSRQTSTAASDRKSAPQPWFRQAG